MQVEVNVDVYTGNLVVSGPDKLKYIQENYPYHSSYMNSDNTKITIHIGDLVVRGLNNNSVFDYVKKNHPSYHPRDYDYRGYDQNDGDIYIFHKREYGSPLIKNPELYSIKNPIFSSPFVFLEHFTSEKNIESIIESGSLLTDIELSKRGSDFVHGICGSDTKHCSAKKLGDYPGIYMSLRTQAHMSKIGNVEKPMVYSNDIKLFMFVFSLALLQQKNYHFNTGDLYGAIIDRTFSPSNLFQNLDRINLFYENEDENPEVVFHDSISLEFCEMVLVLKEKSKRRIIDILEKSKWKHIKVEISSRELFSSMIGIQFVKHLDEYEFLDNSEPQYCYTNVMKGVKPYDKDGKYKGYDMLDKEEETFSKENEEYIWNVTLTNCGIKEKYDPNNQQKYHDLIEEKMQDIYFGSGERAKVLEEPPFKFISKYLKK